MPVDGFVLSFESCLAGQVDTQPFKDLFIHLGEDHGRVYLTAPQSAQLFHGFFCRGIGSCGNGQCDQHFIGMQPGIPVAQMIHLQMLDGVDDLRCD